MSTSSTTKRNEMKLQSKHRVTFSSDIEEYDDDETVVTVEEMDNSCPENEEEIEEIDDAFQQDEPEQCQSPESDAKDSSDNETIIVCPEMEASGQLSNGERVDVAEKETKNVEKTSNFNSNTKSDLKIRAQQHQLLKIHLNVRKCCEFRYLENDRLPRYNGYISQYGLSKDQLDDLENNKRFKRQQMAERRKQYRDAIAQRSAENERAFAKWLNRKQKTTKSHAKNMYDAKK